MSAPYTYFPSAGLTFLRLYSAGIVLIVLIEVSGNGKGMDHDFPATRDGQQINLNTN